MASQKPKPYTIRWPFTPKTAEDIDQSFDILFRQVQLNAPGSGVLPVTLGGTGLGSFVKGDLLYASTATTIDGLSDIATGNVLLSGGVNTAPSYGKVALSGGTTHVTGTLPVTNGGTGHAVYAVGDIVAADTTTTLARIADIATGNVLLSGGVGVLPTYGKVGLTTHVSGVLAEANGGTNQSTYAQGDLLYASAANTLAKLPKDTNVSRYLSNTGTSNAPAWAQVNVSTGVTGVMPIDFGGTAIASYSSGDMIYATGATVLAKLAIGANNRVLRSNGSIPNWGQVSDAFISDVTESKITDGSILARVGADETITGTWTISNASPILKFLESDAAADSQKWRLFAESGQLQFQIASDNELTTSSPLIFVRSGTSISSVAAGGVWNFSNQPRFAAGAVVSNTFGYFVENSAGTDIPIGVVTAGNQLEIGLDSAASMNNTVLAAGQSIVLRTNGADRVAISNVGHVTPNVDNAQNCGNGALRWALVRGVTITPGDLLFENGWVITESDKYGIATAGLVILNHEDDLVAFIEAGGRIYADVLPLAAMPAFVKTTLEQRTGRPRP